MIRTVNKKGNQPKKVSKGVQSKVNDPVSQKIEKVINEVEIKKEISLDDFLEHLKGVEPSTTIRLPSVGKFGYSDVIVLKPILTKHQKTISMTPQFSRLPVYINMIKDRVRDIKGFPIDVLNLTKNDFDFILFLYQVSLDPVLSFTIKCGSCGEENTIDVNIDKDLEKTGFDEKSTKFLFEKQEDGKLWISCKCLNDELQIWFEPLRVSQLLDIYEKLIRSNKKLSISEMRLLEMAFTLVKCEYLSSDTILKFNSVEEKIKFLNELPTDEASKLEEAFEAFSHGVSPTYKFECEKCHFKEEIDLPLITEFDFFNLDEIEKLENILESQFILAKVSGIDLASSDMVSAQTREILLKIINNFYEQIEQIRKNKKK